MGRVARKAALVKAARAARRQAYAPYSSYKVGAAVLGASGRVYTGANVENASYGLTMCAERVAVFAAAAAGERRIEAIAVAVAGAEPARPCGACRQVVREFGLDAVWLLAGARGKWEERSMAALLPGSFGPEDLAS